MHVFDCVCMLWPCLQVARAAASASSFAYGFFPEVQARTEVPAGINVLPKHTEATSSRQRQDEGQQHDHERSLAAHAKPDASLLQGTGPDPMLAAAAAAADSDTHAMHARDQAGAGRGSIAETQEEEEEDGLHASLHEHPPLLRRAQPVAITMAPKTRDPLLRFFEMCPAYAQHDEYTENWMSGWAGVSLQYHQQVYMYIRACMLHGPVLAPSTSSVSTCSLGHQQSFV